LKIKPLADKVLVQPDDVSESTTAGGIIIPDTAKEKPQKGEIVAAGPGRKDENGKAIEMDVKVGDKVLYSKYGGTELEYDGATYLIMSSQDILAVFDK
jgi:chaperonin GroES